MRDERHYNDRQQARRSTERRFDESLGASGSRWDRHSSLRPQGQEEMAVSILNDQTITSAAARNRGRHAPDTSTKEKSKNEKTNDHLHESLRSSTLSTNRKANRVVLSSLCDKIENVSGLMTGHVRRLFNLDELVEPADESSHRSTDRSQGITYRASMQLRPKPQLME